MNATEVNGDWGAVMDTAGHIRVLLERRPAMATREIVDRVEAPEAMVKTALGLLIEQGDVERLRPVFYDRDDRDYFRLRRESDGRHLFAQHLRKTLWMGRPESVRVA